MLKNLTKPLAVVFFYAAALWVFSLARDNALQPDILIRVSDFLRFPISSDPRTFAGAGLELSRHGWLTPDSMWIFRLWPPGFAILLGSIFSIFGVEVPFLSILLVLTIMVCTFMLMTVRRYLSLYVPAAWALGLPLLPFVFSVTRFFLLEPIGLAFGEGFSVIFFITSIFMLLLAVAAGSIRRALVSGVFLALAAYFRSQYELLAVCMLLGALALLVGGVVLSFIRKKSISFGKSGSSLMLVVVAMLSAQLLMLPWRIHNYIESGSLSWVQTADLVARNGLASDEKLLGMGAKFVIIGGGNLACKLEPDYCDKTDKSLFYDAFFRNPGKWLGYKSTFLEKFWFSDIEYFPEVVDDEDYPGDYLENSLILALALSSFCILFAARKMRSASLYFWVFCSFYGCFLIVFSLVQLEVRYFFLMKIFAMFCWIALAATVWSARFGGNRRPADGGRGPGERVENLAPVEVSKRRL